jgi:GH24 family phage-related lysozyme (muramidase)
MRGACITNSGLAGLVRRRAAEVELATSSV